MTSGEDELIYIGRTKHASKRHKQHTHALSKGRHPNYKLQNFLNNKPNVKIVFKILEQTTSFEQSKFIESKYIKSMDRDPRQANIHETREDMRKRARQAKRRWKYKRHRRSSEKYLHMQQDKELRNKGPMARERSKLREKKKRAAKYRRSKWK